MIEFTEYIRKIVQETSPSNGQKGSTVDELAIKPVSAVLTRFYNKLVSFRRTNNINRYQEMSETELDDFGAKFFMTRQQGNTATVMVTIRLNYKIDLNITDSLIATSSNGVSFKPSVTSLISGSSLKKSSDAFSLYSVDVQFTATSSGSSANIGAGDITNLVNAEFDYVSVTNKLPVINGSKHETNEEYYGRLKNSVNNGSLLNNSSIYATMKEVFPTVRQTYVAGAGTKYMNRDLVSATEEKDQKQLDFRGKIPKDSSVEHYAASYIFPPRPGSNLAGVWGPLSSVSRYSYPMSINPIAKQINGVDAAMLGFDYKNEFSIDQYKGLYFNDYNNTAKIETTELVSVRKEMLSNYGDTVLSPNSSWVVGTNNRSSGDFAGLSNNVKAEDVLAFEGGSIKISGGTKYSVSAGKVTGKRVGVKATGTIKLPESEDVYINSNINVILAGVDGSKVDAFNGVGFGIMMYKEYSENDSGEPSYDNAVVYMTHSSPYGGSDVFINTKEMAVSSSGGKVSTPISNTLSSVKSIKEINCAIDATSEYTFEFILKDTLEATLLVERVDGEGDSIELELDSSVLSMFTDPENGILAKSTPYYGTTAKVTLNTDTTEEWEVKDFEVVDTNPGRAITMLEFDVSGIDTDLLIDLRAYAKGSVGNVVAEGYTTFIWDKTVQSTVQSTDSSTINTNGSWVRVSELSDRNGSRVTASGLLSHTVTDLSKYSVSNRYGTKVYLMVVSTGASASSSKFAGSVHGNSQVSLLIDYVSAKSTSSSQYHTKNKADIYVVTTSSSVTDNTVTTTVPYTGGYADVSLNSGIMAPIRSIIRVSINSGTEYESTIPKEDYNLYTDDSDSIGSVNEAYKLVLDPRYTASEVTIEYAPYSNIMEIQEYFNTGSGSNVYGDILVKHSSPVVLDFGITYTGSITEGDVTALVSDYIDSNTTTRLSISDMVRYLYSSGDFSTIVEPISIGYTSGVTTGSFSVSMDIKSIEYFTIGNFKASRS